MRAERPALWSVVLVLLAGVVAVAGGLLGVVWYPDVQPAAPSACTAEPCFDLDIDSSSYVLLPFIAHVILLGLALLVGGVSLLLSLVEALRGHRMRVLFVGAAAVMGPLMVLVGGEIVPHVVNPCVITDVVGAGPPGFCSRTPEGTDVPDNIHALYHGVVGFLPLSLAFAWWWKRAGPLRGGGSSQRYGTVDDRGGSHL